MFNSQLYRKLFLGAAAVALFAVAGCKSEEGSEATNQAPNQPATPPQQAKASPAAAKPVPSKPAAANPATAHAAKAKSNATPKPVPASAKTTEPAQLTSVTVPKGTSITATMGQSLTSDKNHTGDSFAAVLFAPIKVDGKTVLPKGAHVTGRIVGVKNHELKVTLAAVVLHGKSYNLATNSVRPSDQSKNNANSDNQDKASKPKKDNGTLSAKTKLTFKLAKPVTVPVKG